MLDLKPKLAVRKSGLPLGSEEYVVRSLASKIGVDPDKLVQQVLRDSPDNLVPVKDDLTQSQVDKYTPLEKQLPGVHVMSYLDFLLELNAASVLPVTVKEDVPKDTALALQSNSVYLAGRRDQRPETRSALSGGARFFARARLRRSNYRRRVQPVQRQAE